MARAAGPRRGALAAVFAAAFLVLGGCAFLQGPFVREAPRRGVYHLVRPGHTLWRISRAYGVDVEEIAVLNGISDPDRLLAGTRLFIPGAERVIPVPVAGGGRAPKRRPAWVEPPEERGARGRGRRVRAVPRTVRFSWPVRGRVIRRFGSHEGVKYDGIAISTRPAATVRAAAAGRVVFSDWGPGIFGKTIIIRHGDGRFHSVYAHNAQNLVKKGDVVGRGTPIARVGHTGKVEVAQLHFEIRYRTKPRDPLSFLP